MCFKINKIFKKINRNITMKNWFNSSTFTQELFKRKPTMVGTMLNNTTDIPIEMLETKPMPLLQSQFVFEEISTTVTNFLTIILRNLILYNSILLKHQRWCKHI